jgi:hypothetical protein
MLRLRSLQLAIGFVAAAFPVVAQMPQPVPFKVQLTQPLSTKANQKDDKVVAMVLEPEPFKGAILEGKVKESKASEGITKESVLTFGFDTLHHNGKAFPVRSEVTKFYNSKGQENADEEGQIIKKRNDIGKAAIFGGIGAGLGALADSGNRGRGAAIGAGTGMAVGLLFVKFGTKAPNISFSEGSIFELALSDRRQ